MLAQLFRALVIGMRLNQSIEDFTKRARLTAKVTVPTRRVRLKHQESVQFAATSVLPASIRRASRQSSAR